MEVLGKNNRQAHLMRSCPEAAGPDHILQNSGVDMAGEGPVSARPAEMALLLTYPDYAHDRRMVGGYRTLLEQSRTTATPGATRVPPLAGPGYVSPILPLGTRPGRRRDGDEEFGSM